MGDDDEGFGRHGIPSAGDVILHGAIALVLGYFFFVPIKTYVSEAVRPLLTQSSEAPVR